MSTIGGVRVEVDVQVLAETLQVTNLKLLDVDVTGVARRHRAQVRAQILNRLHQVVTTATFLAIRLQAHDRVLTKLIKATSLEQ